MAVKVSQLMSGVMVMLAFGCEGTPTLHLFLWSRWLLWEYGKDSLPDSDTCRTTQASVYEVGWIFFHIWQLLIFEHPLNDSFFYKDFKLKTNKQILNHIFGLMYINKTAGAKRKAPLH